MAQHRVCHGGCSLFEKSVRPVSDGCCVLSVRSGGLQWWSRLLCPDGPLASYSLLTAGCCFSLQFCQGLLRLFSLLGGPYKSVTAMSSEDLTLIIINSSDILFFFIRVLLFSLKSVCFPHSGSVCLGSGASSCQ